MVAGEERGRSPIHGISKSHVYAPVGRQQGLAKGRQQGLKPTTTAGTNEHWASRENGKHMSSWARLVQGQAATKSGQNQRLFRAT